MLNKIYLGMTTSSGKGSKAVVCGFACRIEDKCKLTKADMSYLWRTSGRSR